MKKIKNYIFLFLCFFFFTSSCNASTNTFTRTKDDYLVPSDISVTSTNEWNVMTTPAVNSSEKIYDFAELFTDSEEKSLYQDMISYINENQTDLVLVTISQNSKLEYLQNYGKDYADQVYADDFYDYNDFGYGNTRDGVLILIDMDNHYVYLSGSGESRFIYTDDKCERITSSITSYLSEGDYSSGIKKMIKTLDSYYKLGYNSDSGYIIASDGTLKRNLHIPLLLLISFIGTVIIILILVHKNKLVNLANSSRNYIKKDTLKLNVVSNKFLRSHIKRVPIVRESSSSSFGGGGGHIGSSGMGHSGGGSHF